MSEPFPNLRSSPVSDGNSEQSSGNDEPALRSRYEAELAEIAFLDRAYYAKKDPTTAERAEYAARRDEHERLRAQFRTELMALHCDRCAEQIGLRFCFDGSPRQRPCVGLPCWMPHDLREYMVIALWRCESLVEQLSNPVTKKEGSALMGCDAEDDVPAS